MDTPGTLTLSIHCASCRASFRSRAKNPSPRAAWRQQSAVRSDAKAVTAYLCGECSARFSSEEAALDYLAATLEDQLRADRKGAVVLSAG